MPRLGVSLGLWQDRAYDEVIGTALLADELGFAEIWIGEMATWDAFALGAHLAPRLTRSSLVLGPLAVGVRDPAMVAMGTASVAALAARPVAVALGTSSPVVVEAWHGRSRSRSVTALADSARTVRTLLDGGRSDGGAVARSTGYRLRLPPPRSEVLVAAAGAKAIRVAAQHADRMVVNLVDPATLADLVGQLEQACAELGRPRPLVAVWATAAVGDRLELAIDQLRRGVVGYLAQPGYGEMFIRAGFGDLVVRARGGAPPKELLDAIPAALVEAVGVVGPPEIAAERIAAYAAAGADDVVLVPSATDDDPLGERTLRFAAELG